jgi:CRISPR system Cascade subunit CasA
MDHDTGTTGRPLNRFNLIDEPWIPIAGSGRVSLRALFEIPFPTALEGNPIQKISLLKFLLALCQAASTPQDNAGWEKLGPDGLANKARAYLKGHRDCFWLYGEKPFLQMPKIAKAARQPFGAVLPDVATGNTTVLLQSQMEQPLSDAEKAVLLVQLMGFALGGKKTDNSVVLSPRYTEKQNDKGKPSTGKPGTNLGFLGYLHNFLAGTTLAETLWLNMLTIENIEELKVYPQGVGPIPWETPPAGENDPIAKALKESLMGRLVPFSRFLLLTEDGLHYSEGILHHNYLEGMADPSVALNNSEKKIKVLWVDPSKRPWRSITSLISFLSVSTNAANNFDCPYIHLGMSRIPAIRKKYPTIGLWSGGLRVSSNAGEQYVSGTDDYVESETVFDSATIGENFYYALQNEMDILDKLSRILYGRVMGYYKAMKAEGESFAKQASELFWQLCEKRFQDMVNACGIEGGKEAEKLRPYFFQCVRNSYEAYCPRDTARQLETWAEQYPNLSHFVTENKKIADKPASN